MNIDLMISLKVASILYVLAVLQGFIQALTDLRLPAVKTQSQIDFWNSIP